MSRDIVLEYWKIIRYKTLIIQCVPEGTPIKRFCYESSVGKPCAFTGKACSDFKCIDRADGLRVRYIKIPKYRHISENVNPPKRIQQYSLNGDLLSEFDSVQKAAEWLYVNKKVKTLVSGVRGHISDAARGKIKSAYKYIWKYI